MVAPAQGVIVLVLAPTLALSACSPNAAGAGSGSMPDADGSETDAGESAGTTGGGTGSGGTSGATAPPPADETAEGPALDEGPVAHPDITISHGPTYDFGPQNLSETPEHALTVTNAGEGDATAVQVTGVGGAFSIASHDCGEVLEAGASCGVRVRFDPDLFGDFATELQVGFQDQGVARSVSRALVGRGIGVTGNLLVNPGGEEGDATDIPPMGWTIAYGPNWSASWFEVEPQGGRRTISAGYGPPGFEQFTLYQQIHVAPLTNWGNAEGVRFYYRAFHRAESEGDDPTWVELRFRSNASELEVHPSETVMGTAWSESVGNFVAPGDTHHVQLLLQCTRVYNTWCSGFFDGLEVWAEWLG